MSYSTGNEARDKRLIRAIKEVIAFNEPLDFEHVKDHLPPDFELDAAEVSGMLDEMAHGDEPTPEPWQATCEQLAAAQLIETTPEGTPLKTIEEILPLQAAEDEPPHDPPAKVITEAEARTALDVANARLAKARETMVLAQRALQAKRSDLSAQIHLWQLLFKPLTQTREQLVRETLAANQKYKQDLKDGKVAPPPLRGRAKSYIDQTSGRGGNANDFARRYQGVHTNNNGEPVKVYKGGRRDGIPSQYQNRKLPSQL